MSDLKQAFKNLDSEEVQNKLRSDIQPFRQFAGTAIDALQGFLSFFGVSKQMTERLVAPGSVKQKEDLAKRLISEAFINAKAKGGAVLEQFQQKLDALPIFPSPTLRQAVQEVRKQYMVAKQKASAMLDTASELEQRARQKIDEVNQQSLGHRVTGETDSALSEADSLLNKAKDIYNNIGGNYEKQI